jgi:hypothetical protein
MAKRFAQFLFLVALCVLCASGSLAQVRTTGQIIGVVEDPTGAVILGAKVVVVDIATGLLKETVTDSDGRFAASDLINGSYRVTVTMQGFRTAVYENVKVDVGRTSNLTVKMALGGVAETITVETGTDVLQTTTTSIESTIHGTHLRGLPLNNRDVLDFVLLMPGGQQAGSARQATFNGLPKGALNITMDGLNIQDNINKSSFGGGMFTVIRPKLDNVEEISVTTAAAGADAAGEGAVTIRFVTRRGGNDFHGGAFYQYRHESFNANTWLNNANGQISGPLAGGQERNPRNKNRLTVYGANVGGPLIKDKLFFFFSYEDFRLPGSQARNNTVLTTAAQGGAYAYATSAAIAGGPASLPAHVTCASAATPIPTGTVCTAQLLTLAGNNLLPNTLDPVVLGMFGQINPIVASGRSSLDLFRDSFVYTAPADQRRWFPTMRMDWNITPKLRWQGVANYNEFISFPDTLNFEDASFPGLGFEGGQFGRRFSLTTAINWEVRPNISYEFRLGRQSAITRFFPEHEPGTGGPGDLLNLFNHGGLRYSLCWPLGLTSTDASPGFGGGGCQHSFPSPRDTPVMQTGNNVYWQKGKHGINMGTSLTVVTSWSNAFGNAGVPNVTLGLATNDPARTIITRGASTLPGIDPTDPTSIVANARNLYALLVGRVASASSTRNVNELSKQYASLAPLTRRDRGNEFGAYITDTWRAFPTVTVTGGIRWEYQGIPYNRNGIYTSPTFEDLWGASGVNNIFKPGTLTGNLNPQINLHDRNLANRFMKAWAPSMGLAWTPKFDSTVYKWIFGGPNKSVFRAGYSIAFTREGFTHFQQMAGSNPGLTQANNSVAGTQYCLAGGTIASNTCQLLRNGLPPVQASPAAFAFPVPMSNFTFSNSMNAYDKNIRPPYVQSWTASWQREITPTTVVEFRYVANHGTALWRRFNLNEVNIFDNIAPGNGFLQEFIRAQANLAAFIAANPLCGQTGQPACSFAAGPNALPLLTAAFSGVPGTATGTFASAVQASDGFASTTFVQQLQEGQAGAFANGLAGNPSYLCRLVGNQLTACNNRNLAGGVPVALGAGLFPSNVFQVNPDLAGVSAFLLANRGNSTYNSLQFEVRRRMSKGLDLNVNYSFSKGITDRYDDSGTSTIQPTSIRNPKYDKGLSPYDITHVIRMYGRYEFPFGTGRKWSSSNGIVNRLIGGWALQSVVAIQSGRPFLLTSGRNTMNQFESGVVTTLSRSQLENLFGDIHTVVGRNFVYYADPTLIGIAGAYPVPPASPSQAANPAFLGPPTTPGVLGKRIFLHGPNFFKPDVSVSKTTVVTEQIKVEFRAEFFNFTNHTNWLVGGPGAVADTVNVTSTSAFGRTQNYLNDLGNQDQGPRMIQFLLRINF